MYSHQNPPTAVTEQLFLPERASDLAGVTQHRSGKQEEAALVSMGESTSLSESHLLIRGFEGITPSRASELGD